MTPPPGLLQLVGTDLLRAYMHGYFMDMKLYHKVRFPLADGGGVLLGEQHSLSPSASHVQMPGIIILLVEMLTVGLFVLPSVQNQCSLHVCMCVYGKTTFVASDLSWSVRVLMHAWWLCVYDNIVNMSTLLLCVL